MGRVDEDQGRLLTFDAERSRGMGTGDGKRNQFFVTGMDRPDRRLVWKVRLNEPAEFDVVIRYASGDRRARGHYVIESGDEKLGKEASRPDRNEPVREETVGMLRLSAGEHSITLYSPDVRGAELFRPLEIKLKPRSR